MVTEERASQAGEPRSEIFERQLIAHMDTLYSTALHLTRNPADAQDLVQDTVVRALRFHHTFKPGTYIRAWLIAILRNTFINDYRKRARRPLHVELTGAETVASIEIGPVAGTDTLELLSDELRFAVDALPETHRRAVIMADLEDRTYQEIADTLECPLGTVMSRIHRGRRMVRESLAFHRREMAFG